MIQQSNIFYLLSIICYPDPFLNVFVHWKNNKSQNCHVELLIEVKLYSVKSIIIVLCFNLFLAKILFYNKRDFFWTIVVSGTAWGTSNGPVHYTTSGSGPGFSIVHSPLSSITRQTNASSTRSSQVFCPGPTLLNQHLYRNFQPFLHRVLLGIVLRESAK